MGLGPRDAVLLDCLLPTCRDMGCRTKLPWQSVEGRWLALQGDPGMTPLLHPSAPVRWVLMCVFEAGLLPGVQSRLHCGPSFPQRGARTGTSPKLPTDVKRSTISLKITAHHHGFQTSCPQCKSLYSWILSMYSSVNNPGSAWIFPGFTVLEFHQFLF